MTQHLRRPALALDQGSLGFHLPFFEYARISADAGFTHVEAPLAVLAKTVSAKDLRQELEGLGLSIGVFTLPWTGPVNGAVSDAEWKTRCDALDDLLKYAKAANASRVSAFFNDLAQSATRLSDSELQSRLAQIDRIALAADVAFCVELNTPRLLNAGRCYVTRMANKRSAVKLLVDVFHLHRFNLGTDWIESLPRDSVGWVHIADAISNTEKDPQRRAIPRQGCLNIPKLLKAIRLTGYFGPISVEVLNPDLLKNDPSEMAVVLWNSARDCIQEAEKYPVEV